MLHEYDVIYELRIMVCGPGLGWLVYLIEELLVSYKTPMLGIYVWHCEDIDEGLDNMAKYHPDIIVTKVIMTINGGDSFAEKTRYSPVILGICGGPLPEFIKLAFDYAGPLNSILFKILRSEAESIIKWKKNNRILMYRDKFGNNEYMNAEQLNFWIQVVDHLIIRHTMLLHSDINVIKFLAEKMGVSRSQVYRRIRIVANIIDAPITNKEMLLMIIEEIREDLLLFNYRRRYK